MTPAPYPPAAPATGAAVKLAEDEDALCVTCYRAAPYVTVRQVRIAIGENGPAEHPACHRHALGFALRNGVALPQ